MKPDKKRPPRDGLFRARPQAPELRAAKDDGMPTIFGHFARFNEWTEINSMFEGNFLERIAPGAFKKTFRENGDNIKLLFQHGRDPQVGDKPLGSLSSLREDEVGAYYEGQLFDTTYNRDLVPGLEAGEYGASFAFRVIREEFDQEPEVSDHNPGGLPERTIKEAQVFEGGPVTFPAYAGATAGVRSLTDEMIVARMASEPEHMRHLLEFAQRDEVPDPVVGEDEPEDETPADDAPAEEPSADDPALPDAPEDEPRADEGSRPDRATTTPADDDFWSSLGRDAKELW